MNFLEFLNESIDEKMYVVEFDFASDDMQDEIDYNPSKKDDIVSKYVKKYIGKLKIKHTILGFESNGWPEIKFTGKKVDLINLLTKLHGDDKDEAEDYFNDFAEEL